MARVDLRKAAYVLPSSFTLGCLFCGFYSIATSFNADGIEDLYRAALAIFFGAVFDMFDGRVARATRTESAMGLQLDSLADVVTFGVAPAALVYNWALDGLGVAGMVISWVWCAAGALRLARFNVLAQKASGKAGNYFVGLPIPLAASVIVSMVVVAHHVGPDAPTRWGLALVVLSVAYLMVSPIRFRSFKKVKWKTRRTILTVTALIAAITLVWVGLEGAYVFLFLVVLYIGLGLAETVVRRRIAHDEPVPPPAV